MDASYSLTASLAKEWRDAVELSKLLELANEVLTIRHLRLFRASCCAILLPFPDDELCSTTVAGFERAAEGRMTLREHNDAYEKMVTPTKSLLRELRTEHAERLESWCFQEALTTNDPRGVTEQIRSIIRHYKNRAGGPEYDLIAKSLADLFNTN